MLFSTKFYYVLQSRIWPRVILIHNIILLIDTSITFQDEIEFVKNSAGFGAETGGSAEALETDVRSRFD